MIYELRFLTGIWWSARLLNEAARFIQQHYLISAFWDPERPPAEAQWEEFADVLFERAEDLIALAEADEEDEYERRQAARSEPEYYAL